MRCQRSLVGHYSASGTQALTVDLLNTLVTTHSSGSVDLLAIIASDNSDISVPLDVAGLDVDRVRVTNLRTMRAAWFGFVSTQYCWVDLHHDFEVAHTAGRQQQYRLHGNGLAKPRVAQL
ncbi:Aste57867_25077 [Aphanomyces stellatus]|uniref:Aste57867_25077 protein n=1 Tax=Aphanomyces stellatus TaxID=120398 RepID=A0A485LS63_9STRA|nr:hypothetical protein As57867_024999 [Aphanomyces stellatus]VFU01708.1 Aste57867_25077 [Aphanomyces stellatus]